MAEQLRPSEQPKLERVGEELSAKSAVIFVAGEVPPNPSKVYKSDKLIVVHHDIYVAPHEPMYEPEQLNEFMDDMIGFQSDRKIEFRHLNFERKQYLMFGNLQFQDFLVKAKTLM